MADWDYYSSKSFILFFIQVNWSSFLTFSFHEIEKAMSSLLLLKMDQKVVWRKIPRGHSKMLSIYTIKWLINCVMLQPWIDKLASSDHKRGYLRGLFEFPTFFNFDLPVCSCQLAISIKCPSVFIPLWSCVQHVYICPPTDLSMTWRVSVSTCTQECAIEPNKNVPPSPNEW